MKRSLLNRSAALLLLMTILMLADFPLYALNEITGPDAIRPGQTYWTMNTYHQSDITQNFEWNDPFEFDAAIMPYIHTGPNVSGGTGAIYLWVDENTPLCTFKIKYKYHPYVSDGNGGLVQGTPVVYEKDISILPHISVPKIYPGEVATVSILDNCNHIGCTYNWSASTTTQPIGCTGCGVTTSPSITLYANPLAALPEYVQVSCIMSNCSGGLSQYAPETKIAELALRNPVINGTHSIGCVATTPTPTYTITASHPMGTNVYQWSVPTFLTVLAGGGLYDNYVTIVENSIGQGDILLQTRAAPQSAIVSEVVHFPIQVCCLAHATATTNVNAPNIDKNQAALDIVASNVIAPGAQAMYHAGGTVDLVNGFRATAGSYFHGYIKECDGSYQIVANDQDETEAVQEAFTETTTGQTTGALETASPAVLTVVPNPTNGLFRVLAPRELGVPQQITVYDALGGVIKVVDEPVSLETTIDLGEQQQGVYLISVSYEQTFLNGRILKN